MATPYVRYPHDATAIERANRDYVARAESQASPYLAEFIDERFNLARAEGAKAERKRTQRVMIGMGAVIALQSIVIFCMAVWR